MFSRFAWYKGRGVRYPAPLEFVAAPRKEMAAIGKMPLLRLIASLLLALSTVRHESVNGEVTDDDGGRNSQQYFSSMMRPVTDFNRRSGRLFTREQAY